MRILTLMLAGGLACGGVAHAECLSDEEQDVKIRVTAQISAVFAAQCPTFPATSLDFKHFGMWKNDNDDLVVQQVFYVTQKKSVACVNKIVKQLKADASKGIAPRCSLLKPQKAEWLPNADSGPSILFYLK
ncbi:hypothetical protein [Rhizobium leguminosarum]|uniref:hypothetical protein n=1 Tax=Rhizobium leguminosarum TaxID=384 RepID=UPI003F9B0A87